MHARSLGVCGRKLGGVHVGVVILDGSPLMRAHDRLLLLVDLGRLLLLYPGKMRHGTLRDPGILEVFG